MSEQKLEIGQLILLRFAGNYTWYVHQYFGEDDERFFILGGSYRKDGIEVLPYEGNEDLLGTTHKPKPNWRPKIGELVAVSDDGKKWFAQVFISKVRGRIEGAYETSDTHDSTQPSYWQYCEPLRKHFSVSEDE